MDDDIDDLLNEVETKFCASGPSSCKSKSAHNLPQNAVVKSPTRVQKKQSDLTNFIDDILEDPSLEDSRKEDPVARSPRTDDCVPGSHNVRTGSLKKGSTKCFPVFIGGSNTPLGLSTTVNARACDALRCTDCDFQVSTFENFQWHSSTDYLFLRNNMPDLHRLKPKLVKKLGCRAYACQCKWKSVVGDLQDLQRDMELKWVCGKH